MNKILKSKIRVWIEITYIVLILSFSGLILTLGAIVAPSVFGSELIILSANLSNFQEGQLMLDMFSKFSYIASYFIFIVLLYELYDYKSKGSDKIIIFSALFLIASSLLFTTYYMPILTQMQELGEISTNSESFKNIHIQSEFNFKIMFLSVLVLSFRRLFLMRIS
jgi:hypothetical protein